MCWRILNHLVTALGYSLQILFLVHLFSCIARIRPLFFYACNLDPLIISKFSLLANLSEDKLLNNPLFCISIFLNNHIYFIFSVCREKGFTRGVGRSLVDTHEDFSVTNFNFTSSVYYHNIYNFPLCTTNCTHGFHKIKSFLILKMKILRYFHWKYEKVVSV